MSWIFGVWQTSEVLDWFSLVLNQILKAGMNSILNASQSQGVDSLAFPSNREFFRLCSLCNVL